MDITRCLWLLICYGLTGYGAMKLLTKIVVVMCFAAEISETVQCEI